MKVPIVLTSNDKRGDTDNKAGFSNSEEAAVGLTDAVPYLLEDQLVAAGCAELACSFYPLTAPW